MKTTIPLLSISALAVTLLLAHPTFANENQMTEAQAQEYARDLLEPEAERGGLDNIREEKPLPEVEGGLEEDELDTAAEEA